MNRADFLIVGSGIVGLTVAREIKLRFPDSRVLIVEKERSLGAHSSGRNSGVLHSGLYYPPSSLKAKLSVRGSKLLGDYCSNRGLSIRRSGKVVVPTRVDDAEVLEELFRRGNANGVKVEKIDAQQLREREPDARTATGQALWVPETGVFDPKEILEALEHDVSEMGVEIWYGVRAIGKGSGPQALRLDSGDEIEFGYLVNCAGLYADRLAQSFDIGEQYTILPFKGLYYELRPQSEIRINSMIYPVPDIRIPFLGVHFTQAVSGKVYVGPSAVPALGRENYRGLGGLSLGESKEVLNWSLRQYLANRQGFRHYANEESLRFIKSRFVRAAQALVPNVHRSDLVRSAKVGIRAQLFDKAKKELVLDFLIEKGERSLHVLNAVSPGFTCSMSFAEFVVDRLMEGAQNQSPFASQPPSTVMDEPVI